MTKFKYFLLANFILLAIWLVTSNTKIRNQDYNINMVVSSDVPETMVQEMKEAIEYFPNKIVESMVKNDWKIVLLTDFEAVDGYEHIGSDSSVVGLINYEEKAITIKGIPKYSDTAKQIMIHEVCHYIDRYWDNISNQESFKELYEKYKDGGYITYVYAGVPIMKEYEQDIYYATSNRKEFFAESLKDYLSHPEYLKENYPEIYEYYRLLLIKKGW